MVEVVFIGTALDEDRDGLHANFDLGSPIIDESNLDLANEGALVKFEKHFVFKVSTLIFDALVVDLVLVGFFVDGPINVLVISDRFGS